MRLLLLTVGLLLALLALAEAGIKAGPNVMPDGHHRLKTPGGAPPLDGLTAPAAAYSFRKVLSAYAGPGMKLRRATGGTQDIGFLGWTGFTGAPLDAAAAAAFCAATTCFLDTWYDQSGNARDWLQPTPASQVQYIADCGGGLPCLRTTGAQYMQAAAQVTPAGPQSLSAVARVDGAAQGCTFVSAAFQSIAAAAAAANFVLTGDVATINGAAPLTVWHAAAGVVTGPASVLGLDGVETTGAVPVNTGTTNFYGAYGGAGAGTCSQREVIWWQTYALTAGERAALVSNQRDFWGF